MVGWVVVSSRIEPAAELARVDHGLYLAAFLVYGLGFVAASWRWYLLLHHIRVQLPFFTVLRLALIGLFFNLFVPGGVGGDLIKMVYMKKESGDRYPQALLTVFLDRLMGLGGLLLVALLAIAGNPAAFASSSPEMKGIMGVVGLAAVGGLLFGIAFLIWPLLSRWASGPAASLAGKLPPAVSGAAAKIVEALNLLRAAPLKLVGLLLLSTVGHLSAALGVFLVARGLGVGAELTFPECMLATTLANLVASIPLTPGGLGGRDVVTKLLLTAAGAPLAAAGAVPVLVTVLLISWSLIGGLALLWERGSGVAAGFTEPPANSA